MSSHPDQHTGLVAYVIDPDAGEQSTTPISTTVEAMCNQRLELFEEWKERGYSVNDSQDKYEEVYNQSVQVHDLQQYGGEEEEDQAARLVRAAVRATSEVCVFFFYYYYSSFLRFSFLVVFLCFQKEC